MKEAPDAGHHGDLEIGGVTSSRVHSVREAVGVDAMDWGGELAEGVGEPVLPGEVGLSSRAPAGSGSRAVGLEVALDHRVVHVRAVEVADVLLGDGVEEAHHAVHPGPDLLVGQDLVHVVEYVHRHQDRDPVRCPSGGLEDHPRAH